MRKPDRFEVRHPAGYEPLPPVGVADEELRRFFAIFDGRRWSSVLEDREDYRVVIARLRRLDEHHAGVLRAAYTPRSWPEGLREELGRLTGVVVRLASAEMGWPSEQWDQEMLEVRVATQLEVARAASGRVVFAPYRTHARALLRRALAAYAPMGGPRA